MKTTRKELKHLTEKPDISSKVKKILTNFDLGANGMSHRYPQLKEDHYDALDLLQELVNESNYDGRINTSQDQLKKVLNTDSNSLNFDLLSLDRLGMIQIDVTQLARKQNHFTCKLIPHKIF